MIACLPTDLDYSYSRSCEADFIVDTDIAYSHMIKSIIWSALSIYKT